MRLRSLSAGLVLATVLGSSSSAVASGSATTGQSVFAGHCAACHSTQLGVNQIGPSLAGIVGSKSGSVAGFDFSIAMKNAQITWDDADLDKFLANPAGFVRGTKMFVNLPNATDRQNVIAYLDAIKK